MFEILFSRRAENELKKLPKDVQKRVIKALERVRIKPEHYLTRLVGEKCYKLRVGDYRVLLDLDKRNLHLIVLKIGHRKNIYERQL